MTAVVNATVVVADVLAAVLAAIPARVAAAATTFAALCLLAGPALAQSTSETQLLDDFKDASRWQASASDQVTARIAPDDQGGLCLHYDFGRVSGYAVARRALPLDLPAHYGFTLRLRGAGPANHFQVKWVDASGDNVWWRNLPNYTPPAAAQDLKIRQRQIEFAWGPTDEKLLRSPAAMELVVASGQGGGAGKLCFERLTLQRLPAPGPVAEAVLRHSGEGNTAGSTLDLGAVREINGLLWRRADVLPAAPRRADLQLSDDGRHWRTVQRLRSSQRVMQALWLPEQEARYLRLRGAAVASLQAFSSSDWPDRNAMLKAVAALAPRSQHPRSLHGEQNYWTLVGVDGGGASAALISEDGEIEPRRGGPSLAPLVIDGQGRRFGWAEVQADGRSSTTLREGHLPLPQVQWTHPRFGLAIETGADGVRQQAQLIARYTLHNPTAQRQRLTLVLAVRPWQVNPPQQFLNTPGGVTEIGRLGWQGQTLQVNGRPFLQALDSPAQVRAAAFDQADVLDSSPQQPVTQPVTQPGTQPITQPVTLTDPQGLASARLDWPLDLGAGERQTITITLPLAGTAIPPADSRAADAQLDAVAAAWRIRLNRVQFTLPPQAQVLHNSLRAALSHILMSRDGPALQPGTRSYARSWVRDGAMMVAGLLRLGEVDAAREFVDWYAGQLFASGKVPCCVDARGADPVAENDSHGQFVFAVAELWRHSAQGPQDRAWLARRWPQVDAAARYMELLRQSERTPANHQPGREAFWGLMPASISHEGYSAKPMHSYWDNFWALTGWRDAALLARALASEGAGGPAGLAKDTGNASAGLAKDSGNASAGLTKDSSNASAGLALRADQLDTQHAEFRRELGQSLARAMAQHRITHLPGAAELGDFDPTSSTLVFSPAGAEGLVSEDTLRATWQRWWDESQQRSTGTGPAWAEYTPYELRSVSALLRLGQPERAHTMLDFFHRDQRPAGWHQWAEVVDRQPRRARFIGDMPHAWISSDYIRSGLDLLAFERDSDQALVLAAGVRPDWLDPGPVGVTGLRTAHGMLGYRLARGAGPGQPVELTLAPGLAEPPGGLWLSWQGRLHRLPAGTTRWLLQTATPAAVVTAVWATMPGPPPTPTRRCSTGFWRSAGRLPQPLIRRRRAWQAHRWHSACIRPR